MVRTVLRDDQWERVKDHLPGKATDRGVAARDDRHFLEAVLWINRTGSPWRDRPSAFGHWHRVYVRSGHVVSCRFPDLAGLIENATQSLSLSRQNL
jgi:transposase